MGKIEKTTFRKNDSLVRKTKISDFSDQTVISADNHIDNRKKTVYN